QNNENIGNRSAMVNTVGALGNGEGAGLVNKNQIDPNGKGINQDGDKHEEKGVVESTAAINVQAYDNLALSNATTVLTNNKGIKDVVDRGEVSAQFGKDKVGTGALQAAANQVVANAQIEKEKLGALKSAFDHATVSVQTGNGSKYRATDDRVNSETGGEQKNPLSQVSEREQGFEQGTLAQGTGISSNLEASTPMEAITDRVVADVNPVDKEAVKGAKGVGQFKTVAKLPSASGQVDTQQKQSNVQQVSGEKLADYVDVTDGVKAGNINLEQTQGLTESKQLPTAQKPIVRAGED
ncbi:hypothetical protein A4A49_39656, partial [Nicotiana attenuata]